ncbi:MAG TPA: hypothetical protein HA230_02440 [Candidatus Aenigmarchaeota archaeon]|nr:hypothetical protein [Candidatus Aenigmarchaeota archaeon]
MKKLSHIECEIFIIDYLLSHRYVDHKQTTFEIMVRHVPTNDRKIASHSLENLIRKGFISTKRKHYGVHISLIPDKLGEIRVYLHSLENQ